MLYMRDHTCMFAVAVFCLFGFFLKKNFPKTLFCPLCSIQHVYGAQHPPFDPLLHGT